jgi:hypothetical protein
METETSAPSTYVFDDPDLVLADERARHIETAIVFLHARDYGGRYAYADAATGNAYLVDDECLADLGRRLETSRLASLDQDNAIALRLWSAETEAIEVDAALIYRSIDRHLALDVQRETAMRKDNLPIVVAIDFFPETLRALLSPY